MSDNFTIGKAISRLRKSMHLTQQSLADNLYVSHQAVSKWEHGVALPDIMTLYRLARFFGVTIEQLITDDTRERENELKYAFSN